MGQGPEKQLSGLGSEFHRRGWVLGTSGNFSAIAGRDPFRMCITASGNDKGALDGSHFLTVDADAGVIAGSGTPSAETLIHLTLYGMLEGVGSVLHTHSVWGTILSDVFFPQGAIVIENYEMLKGLAGVRTHEHRETVPIVENSQDYPALAAEIKRVLNGNPNAHGVYLRRHGLYTWGGSIAEAKRHVEIFEFLFEVIGRRLK
jgi:methylthioribulose-1-phosphate dehydratase